MGRVRWGREGRVRWGREGRVRWGREGRVRWGREERARWGRVIRVRWGRKEWGGGGGLEMNLDQRIGDHCLPRNPRAYGNN